MLIEKIEIFPVRIKKEHVYLGNSSGLSSKYDYYLRPEYRCPYSKNMETLYVKITTDSGIVGWGEALAPVLPDVGGKIIQELFAPVLLGRNPLDIKVIWNQLYDLMRDRGYYSGFMVDAITAVDCDCGISQESIWGCLCTSCWAVPIVRKSRHIYRGFLLRGWKKR